MSTKDYLEIGFWIINVIILIFTVYWIATSPVKAVQIGRRLDNEQNKNKSKMDLFLTLFSLRGSPAHYEFVIALNKIDIVFQDSPEVLSAWKKLYDSLNIPSQNNVQEIWSLLRTDLLSEMAKHLNYQEIKQVDIQRTYTPKAHLDSQELSQDYNSVMRNYFEMGAKYYEAYLKSTEGK